jgi:hypothetical protein
LKIIVHAGMHKTGSSSIQDTFSKADITPVEYLPDTPANHSGLMMLLFMEKVENFHSFRARGKTRPQLLEERKVAQEQLTQYFADTRAETVMISGESISGMNLRETERLAEFLYAQTKNVQVIAYVRPPCSFITSSFQQKLKSGDRKKFQPSELWPDYRRRFAKFFRVFGKDNVTLRPFIRGEMKDGNVVLDIAEFLGVRIAEEDVVVSNESLSLEATSLLYAQRNLGKGMLTGFDRVHRINKDFIQLLSGIGTRKMAFSRSLLEEIVQDQAADMEWIEARLGRKFLDLPEIGSGGVSCEADLFEIASEQQEFLDRMIAERFNSGSGTPPEQIARKLDLLMSSFI